MKLTKSEIYDLAKAINDGMERSNKHEEVCLKALICPKCGNKLNIRTICLVPGGYYKCSKCRYEKTV